MVPQAAEPIEEPTSLRLKIPEELARPVFANYIHASITSTEVAGSEVTLTFVHIFPVPVEAGDSVPQGEAVARVTMTRSAAAALRDLLERQIPARGRAGRRKSRT